MTIRCTYGDISADTVTSANALRAQPVAVDLMIKIGKITREIKRIFEQVSDDARALAIKHGTKMENGNITIAPENANAYQTELLELQRTVLQLDCDPLTRAELGTTPIAAALDFIIGEG